MNLTPRSKVISTIFKHDAKITSYKIALLRAINDIALSFPDLPDHNKDVAIPLRMLAAFWVAYYWPFVDPINPIVQKFVRTDLILQVLLRHQHQSGFRCN